MSRFSSTLLHNFAFALALAILATLAWQGKRTQDALLGHTEAAASSLELITEIQGLLSALQDVETGSRGYLLTGQASYLEPYESGLADIGHLRGSLGERLLDRDPRYASWLAAFDDELAHRLRIARENNAARRELGFEGAARRLASSGGKQSMDRLRAHLDGLESAERTRLAADRAAVSQQFARGRLQLLYGSVVVLLLLVGTFVAMNRNLRSRQRLAAKARASEARMGALLLAVPDALFVIEEDDRLVPLSGSESLARTVPQGLSRRLREEARVVRDHGNAVPKPFEWQEPDDGRTFEVRMAAAGHGTLLAIIRNITEAMRTRREVREQRAFLRSVVDADESLIFVRDGAGRFVLCNRAFAALLGTVPRDVEGRLPRDIAGLPRVAALFDGDQRLFAGEPWDQGEVRVLDKAGEERWLLLHKQLLEREEDQQVLAVAMDVSERRRVDRMKSEFISTVSHELRTPLTAVRGALGMLIGGMAGDVPGEARPLLDIAHKNCERLVRLINDILDVEKLDAGRLQLQLQRLAVAPLVSQAVAQIGPYAHEFGITLEVEGDIDGVVLGDPDRLAQVMANLLSNAIKHSPRGSAVQVRLARDGDDALVSVVDHGEGIPEAFRPRIFERFAQADASDVRRRGGTGLGLAITRSLVEQHGGRIGFETVEGEGTRFDVHLPLAPAEAPRRDTGSDANAGAGASIVVLDDDEASARQLVAVLAARGYRPHAARTGADARALLAAHPAEGMLVNLSFAGEDAFSFIRGLRAEAAYRHLPLVAVGLEPNEDGTQLAGGAIGIADWVRKPFDEDRLVEAVRACIHGQRDRARVLHVEDDDDLRTVVASMLAAEPLELDGAATLADARARLEAAHYDLVILDLMLPDGDGAELLDSLAAARPPTRVIIFSARDTALPESSVVMRRLVKSRQGTPELAETIHEQLAGWPCRKGHGGPTP